MKEYYYFIAVAEEQSFSKAAQRLFLAQSSLSQSIKSLEDKLDITLFNRLPRGVTLTDAGQVFLEKAYALTALENSLFSELHHFQKTYTGTVTIGLTNYWATLLFPHILGPFTKKYPNVQIAIHEATTHQLKEALQRRQLDLVLITSEETPIIHDNQETTHLFQEELKVAVPNHLCEQIAMDYVTEKDMVKLPFTVLHEGQRLRTIFNQLTSHSTVQPNIVLTTQSVMTAYTLASTQFAATIIPESLPLLMTTKESVTLYKLTKDHYFWNLYAIFPRKHDLKPIIVDFLNMSKNILSLDTLK